MERKGYSRSEGLDGMDRISLANTIFEGENNVYVLEHNPAILIDTGIATENTRAHLRDGLMEHGLDLPDIEYIFLTHHHADHSGLAGEIQQESDAEIFAHPLESPFIEGDQEAWDAIGQCHRKRFEEWGMPESKRKDVLSILEGDRDRYGSTATVTPMSNGEVFETDATQIEAIYSPGHTAGHLSFAVNNEIFSGDALLPKYTPNVGGADVRIDGALAKYLDTLGLFVSGEYDIAWPGHRSPIDSPAGRALAIIEHHEERSFRVLNILASNGPADAWEVSAALFGELDGIHVLHGPGEAFAHLEHLENIGAIERDGDTTYRIKTETASRLESISNERWPLRSEESRS